MVHLTAQVAANGHGRAGTKVDAADGRGHLDEADNDHGDAGRPNEAGVALGDALVNDLGVEAGQIQRGNGGNQLQHQHGADPGPIRLCVPDRQAEQFHEGIPFEYTFESRGTNIKHPAQGNHNRYFTGQGGPPARPMAFTAADIHGRGHSSTSD